MKITIDDVVRDMTPEEIQEFENSRQQFRDATVKIIANESRQKRDDLLLRSDWTQLPNAKVSDQQAWEVYRQALRDIPQQAGFPENIDWPTAPGA